MEQLGLDRLLLVVANDPWQKSGQRAVSSAEDRYALAEALAHEIPGAEANRLEIDRGGPSYSVDTTEELLARSGARPRELFLVVGADLVGELRTWHRSEDLAGLVTLAVVSRPARSSLRCHVLSSPTRSAPTTRKSSRGRAPDRPRSSSAVSTE